MALTRSSLLAFLALASCSCGAMRGHVGRRAGLRLCTPVMSVHLCKVGSDKWSVADKIKKLHSDDKKCMSQLCDKQRKQVCCDARNALLLAGVLADEFKYEADAVIRMPAPPEKGPRPIIAELESDQTTCSKYSKMVMFGTWKVNFPLPEGEPGKKVELKCGKGAKDPDQVVTFACGDDLEWQQTAGSCEKEDGVRCPEYAGINSFKLYMKFQNDEVAHATYSFDLPEQPNKFLKDVPVSAKCPSNAKNPKGEAIFICDAKGAWALKEQTCSKMDTSTSTCPAMTIKLSLDDHVMDYKIPSKGLNIRYADKEEVLGIPCKFGPYTRGQAALKCQAGQWTFEHQCSDPAASKPALPKPALSTEAVAQTGAATCGAADFTLSLGIQNKTYDLPSVAAGTRRIEKCAHGALTVGDVVFECKANDRAAKWEYVSQTCKAPPGSGCKAAEPTLQMSGPGGVVFKWRFKLAEVSSPGLYEYSCPEGHSGMAQFECQQDNTWNYVKGSAKCKPA